MKIRVRLYKKPTLLVPPGKVASGRASENCYVNNFNDRLRAEGINPNEVLPVTPRWQETAPLQPSVLSILVGYDLIVRSDGSAVSLDEHMAGETRALFRIYAKGQTDDLDTRTVKCMFPEVESYDEQPYELLRRAQEILGWDWYTVRLREGVLNP